MLQFAIRIHDKECHVFTYNSLFFMVLNTMVRLSDVIVKSDIVLGTKIQLA